MLSSFVPLIGNVRKGSGFVRRARGLTRRSFSIQSHRTGRAALQHPTFGEITPYAIADCGKISQAHDAEALLTHRAERPRLCRLIFFLAHSHRLFGTRLVGTRPATSMSPKNVSIVRPTAKCSELNPVANIWQFMRENWLSNRIYPSYENIVDLCCEAWNKLVVRPGRIMAIGRRKWTRGS